MKKGIGGPIWLKEAGVTAIWAAAAVNVFLITWKTWFGVYKFPPAEALEGNINEPKGGFTPLVRGTPGNEGESVSKPREKKKRKYKPNPSSQEKAEMTVEGLVDGTGGFGP